MSNEIIFGGAKQANHLPGENQQAGNKQGDNRKPKQLRRKSSEFRDYKQLGETDQQGQADQIKPQRNTEG